MTASATPENYTTLTDVTLRLRRASAARRFARFEEDAAN